MDTKLLALIYASAWNALTHLGKTYLSSKIQPECHNLCGPFLSPKHMATSTLQSPFCLVQTNFIAFMYCVHSYIYYSPRKSLGSLKTWIIPYLLMFGCATQRALDKCWQITA